ncbi:hypothetical protein [Sneathiella sp.]|jgi:hypothetical protein|uniref:hypothetical protein n=1 Tax=Sneathiella sp. TaxID=1964365 RepID=UPI0039E5D138
MNATMQHTPPSPEKQANLKAIFEILAYLKVDAIRDGEKELAARLDFAMNCAEEQLATVSRAQTIPPVNTGIPANL